MYGKRNIHLKTITAASHKIYFFPQNYSNYEEFHHFYRQLCTVAVELFPTLYTIHPSFSDFKYLTSNKKHKLRIRTITLSF